MKKFFSMLGTLVDVGLILGIPAVAFVLILWISRLVPNGYYVSRFEYAFAIAVLVLAIILLLVMTRRLATHVSNLKNYLRAIENRFNRTLFDDQGHKKFVEVDTLYAGLEFKRSVRNVLDQIEAERQDDLRAEEERGMDELKDLRVQLAKFGVTKFVEADTQARYEELTAKYGAKLDTLDKLLNAPTTTLPPIVATTTPDTVVAPAPAPAKKMSVKRRKNAAS